MGRYEGLDGFSEGVSEKLMDKENLCEVEHKFINDYFGDNLCLNISAGNGNCIRGKRVGFNMNICI